MLRGARDGAWAKSGGPAPIEFDGLTMTAVEAGSSVKMESVGSAPIVELEYSLDGIIWRTFLVNDTQVNLRNIGDSVCFRAKEGYYNTFASSVIDYNKFILNGRISAKNNINSLLSSDFNQIDTLSGNYCLAHLFSGCVALVTAPDLPATGLVNYCYYRLFQECTNLVNAPILPAQIPARSHCYDYLFYGCSSLEFIKLYHIGSFTTTTTQNWVGGSFSPSGKFYYNGTSTSRGKSAIPIGWEVVRFED